jgi:RNA polymerase sigma factor (sigma-70 family)
MRMNNEQFLTLEEEQALAEKAKNGDIKARNDLIMAHMPMIASFCSRRYGARIVGKEDMQHEIIALLCDVFDRYDPKIARFSTWARTRVLQAYYEALNSKGSTISIACSPASKWVLKNLHRISSGKVADKELAEVSKRLKCSLVRIKAAIEVLTATHVEIIESAYSEDNPSGVQIADPNAGNAVERIIEAERRQVVWEAAEQILTDREYKVLRDRMKDPQRTLDELSEELGVTRERVRQIEMKAIQKLREHFE